MFQNLESFSIFFFVSLAIIILGIIFEDKLIAMEKRAALKKNPPKAQSRKGKVSAAAASAQKTAKSSSAPRQSRRTGIAA